MREAVIVSAVRTPLGSFNGGLSTIGATDLGGIIIREAVRRAGIDPVQVNEVIMGQVLTCGYGQNPARQAAIKAGLPWGAESLTVNKVCGSGLKAVMLAAQAVQTGDAEIVVAGGMENMSMAPYYLEKARFGYRMGTGSLQDHMVHDGLWDVVNDFHMGISNEICCKRYQISREVQDRYAERSYQRALNAQTAGLFDTERIPIEIPQHNGKSRVLNHDECLRETPYKVLSKMEPAFKKKGVGTAGNASPISDGSRRRGSDVPGIKPKALDVRFRPQLVPKHLTASMRNMFLSRRSGRSPNAWPKKILLCHRWIYLKSMKHSPVPPVRSCRSWVWTPPRLTLTAAVWPWAIPSAPAVVEFL